MAMVREVAGLFDHPLMISVALGSCPETGDPRVALVERRGGAVIGEIAMDRDTARWLAGELLAASRAETALAAITAL
jgi:hypothetical protein